MRLIDKESFKDNILDKQMYLITTQEGVFCYYVAVLDAIEFEPEVKAIPVKWIKKWTKQFYDKDGRYNGEGYDSVWDLLADWEKENETNRR